MADADADNFDEVVVQRWAGYGSMSRPRNESRPLNECPFCGEYTYRRVKYFMYEHSSGWFIPKREVVGAIEKLACKNCGYENYRKEIDTDDVW